MSLEGRIEEPELPDGLQNLRSFKLRFAAHRELGRSRVSAVKPLGLPALVTDKCGGREANDSLDKRVESDALRRVAIAFRLGPRDKHLAPQLSSQEYGWWSSEGGRWKESQWLHHHIKDSPWLKTSLRVLTSDAISQR
ncbi:unnamed protein product [Leptosia nina]|uniref:Uncharacterized protein n=1 Tax=Leptosia nina TaxID=320188 RepID=A0AAV1JTB1_9NEOP